MFHIGRILNGLRLFLCSKQLDFVNFTLESVNVSRHVKHL